MCIVVHPPKKPTSLSFLLLLRNLSGLVSARERLVRLLVSARERLARLLVEQPIRLLARLANLLKDGRLEVGLRHHGGRLAGEVDLEGLDVCACRKNSVLAGVAGSTRWEGMFKAKGSNGMRPWGGGGKSQWEASNVPPLSLSLLSTRVTAPEHPPHVMATEYL